MSQHERGRSGRNLNFFLPKTETWYKWSHCSCSKAGSWVPVQPCYIGLVSSLWLFPAIYFSFIVVLNFYSESQQLVGPHPRRPNADSVSFRHRIGFSQEWLEHLKLQSCWSPNWQYCLHFYYCIMPTFQDGLENLRTSQGSFYVNPGTRRFELNFDPMVAKILMI